MTTKTEIEVDNQRVVPVVVFSDLEIGTYFYRDNRLMVKTDRPGIGMSILTGYLHPFDGNDVVAPCRKIFVTAI